MKKYKLYQLLKLRKKMVTQINDLKRKFSHNNSKLKDAKLIFNVELVLEEIEAIKVKLVIVKKAIRENTLPVYDKIDAIDENKDLISLLKSTSTNDGLVESRGYGDNPPSEYTATIGAVEMEKKIKDYEALIDELQEQIDEHNYTTEVELPF